AVVVGAQQLVVVLEDREEGVLADVLDVLVGGSERATAQRAAGDGGDQRGVALDEPRPGAGARGDAALDEGAVGGGRVGRVEGVVRVVHQGDAAQRRRRGRRRRRRRARRRRGHGERIRGERLLVGPGRAG